MRRLFLILKTIPAIIGVLFMCCASSISIKDKTCEPVGIFTMDKKCDCENVEYRTNKKNLIWSIITVETIIIPLWLMGTQAYEPVLIDTINFNCN